MIISALLAAALTYPGVSAALRASGAGWFAKPTPPGLVPTGGALEEAEPADRSRSPSVFDAFVATHGGPAVGETLAPDLPATFDWRTHQPNPFSQVTAQGSCSSCVAFAVTAALEAQLALACGEGGAPGPLSRQYLFSCGGGSCRSGWRLSDAVTFLTANGVPDDGCFPYQGRSDPEAPCAGACPDRADRLIQGVTAERPTSGFVDVADVKRALMKGPLVSSMILFDDLQFYGGGIYRHVNGPQLGSHAIVLVGWSDADSAWIARNSWGEGWGDHGYFEVAWDDLSLPARYTWLFDVGGAVERGACSRPR